MPIYEYDCDSCNQSLEAIQKVYEQPLAVCPRCGEKSLQKKTSLNSFQLKGSGWYRDGYGGKSSVNGPDKAPTVMDPHREQKPQANSPAA